MLLRVLVYYLVIFYVWCLSLVALIPSDSHWIFGSTGYPIGRYWYWCPLCVMPVCVGLDSKSLPLNPLDMFWVFWYWHYNLCVSDIWIPYAFHVSLGVRPLSRCLDSLWFPIIPYDSHVSLCVRPLSRCLDSLWLFPMISMCRCVSGLCLDVWIPYDSLLFPMIPMYLCVWGLCLDVWILYDSLLFPMIPMYLCVCSLCLDVWIPYDSQVLLCVCEASV